MSSFTHKDHVDNIKKRKKSIVFILFFSNTINFSYCTSLDLTGQNPSPPETLSSLSFITKHFPLLREIEINARAVMRLPSGEVDEIAPSHCQQQSVFSYLLLQ